MKIKADKNNILVLTADTQYELAATFMRMQEYYESPKFRGKIVRLEAYMDWYASEYGNFTYTSDWNGFNVPGSAVRKFFKLHWDSLLEKEHRLYDILAPWINREEKFYVVGTWKADNTVEHEFCHAFYYIDPAFKQEMNTLLKTVSEEFRDRCIKVLVEDGYHSSVFIDESIAYLATNTMPEFADMFKNDIPWHEILPLQIAFEKRYEEYEKNNSLA